MDTSYVDESTITHMQELAKSDILKEDVTDAVQYLGTTKYVVSSRRAMQGQRSISRTAWRPFDVFGDAHCEYAVIVLNRPIHWKHSVMLRIWQQARVTVTVDGGTNRWLKYLEEQGIEALNGKYREYLPDLITGDMDSCSSIVIEKLKTLGPVVVETPDQDQTDYTKALLQLKEYIEANNINLDEVYVLAETSGRFDHIIGNINTLYKSDELVENAQVIQVASNSFTWLLKPGTHSIHIPEILVERQSWCGLLPFGCPANCVTTNGLKWNLNEGTMQFGGLVSTSNTYDDFEVTVTTDTAIIWTMGIEPFKKTL